MRRRTTLSMEMRQPSLTGSSFRTASRAARSPCPIRSVPINIILAPGPLPSRGDARGHGVPVGRIAVSPVEVRDLGEPEAVVTYPLGAAYQVRLAGTVVSRHVLQPGWSWEAHAQPLVGTASCELYHRGVVLRGRMGIRTDEGAEVVIGPNQVFDLPPGHVTWVEGDEELVMVDWAGAPDSTRRGARAAHASWPPSCLPT